MGSTVITPRPRNTSLRNAIAGLKLDVPQYGPRNASYILPCNQLGPFLLSQQHRIEAMLGEKEDGPVSGWKTYLSERAAAIARADSKATFRRLYDVLNVKANCINSDLGEAFVMACDKDLDTDTTIPTLPAQRWSAFDLLSIRAKAADPKVNVRELLPLVSVVLRLSAAIIATPELTGHLQDDAPFNCLRPWSVDD